MKIPFDIKYRPQIESGEYKVVSRENKPARIVCWDMKSDHYPILALIDDGAKELYKNFTTKGRYYVEGDEDSKDLFIIIPELKESEDEKIRKSLSAYFAKFKPNDMWDADFSFGDIVAWLEKQGEKKPVNNVEPKFKVGDKIQYLKGCGTIMTIEKIENDEYIYANNLGHTTIEDGNKWYLVERNPTWSKEDEDYFDAIIVKLEVTQEDAALTDNQMNFLKSLKNRIQLQPKQEWSEEDQKKLIEAINIVDGIKYTEMKKEPQNRIASIDYYQTIIDWLESLRLQPKQNPVEWSEKDEKILKDLILQLEALKCSFALDFKVAIKWLKSLKLRLK
jgi:hypothetical protein